MQSSMSNDPRDRAPNDDPPYRRYGTSPSGRSDRSDFVERPYTVYRSTPRGLRARLRGDEDTALAEDGRPRRNGGGRDGGGEDGGGRDGRHEPGSPRRRAITPRRVVKYLAVAVVAWLVLSLVLFGVSAQIQSGSIPSSAQAALTSGGNLLTSTDTILVLGTDQRPKGSKEPGANTSDKGSRSDTIMLWRIGGGVSRRLSIPRDTVASIPGHGSAKINAAYAYGGPALAIRTVQQFIGVKINHLIIVNLANFPKFIDAIGGVDVSTGRICSQISGGVQNGGFTLDLRPGSHHLTGVQALTLARTRENRCNAASNDLTREGYQQKILNAIKFKLLSPPTFFHLPWAAWYAPQTLRTEMGAFTLLSLFGAAETGGSAPTRILKPTGSATLPDGESALVASPGAVHRAVDKLING